MNEMVGSIKAQLAIVPPELVKPICIGAIAIAEGGVNKAVLHERALVGSDALGIWTDHR